MPETCRHCGAEVHYECNGASRCRACGEKLYGLNFGELLQKAQGDGLLADVLRLEPVFSIREAFAVLDPAAIVSLLDG